MISAWLDAVPYQGTRPRISRSSVVPISATHPAATGPPRVMAARRGAIATDTNVPRGMRTGRAWANSVIRVQNASPAATLGILGSSRTIVISRRIPRMRPAF